MSSKYATAFQLKIQLKPLSIYFKKYTYITYRRILSTSTQICTFRKNSLFKTIPGAFWYNKCTSLLLALTFWGFTFHKDNSSNCICTFLGLNLEIASKSPVSATTRVPDARSCSNEDILGFLLSLSVIIKKC